VAAMKVLSSRLPDGVGYDWTNMTYQEIKAGNLAPLIFGLAFIFVFLILAAQYESWSTPLAVLLAVPGGLFGALVLTYLRKFDNNIYTQIGLVMLVGMVAKTAILVVEFAVAKRQEGLSVAEAAATAAGLRFRAILMTVLCMAIGVVPLLVASGAGANSRRALGTVIFGGMVATMTIGMFLMPMMYSFIARFTKVKPKAAAAAATEPGAAPAAASH
jgi:multidrug efflux pump subunit AcrB